MEMDTLPSREEQSVDVGKELENIAKTVRAQKRPAKARESSGHQDSLDSLKAAVARLKARIELLEECIRRLE
jgi:hypothetical protein